VRRKAFLCAKEKPSSEVACGMEGRTRTRNQFRQASFWRQTFCQLVVGSSCKRTAEVSWNGSRRLWDRVRSRPTRTKREVGRGTSSRMRKLAYKFIESQHTPEDQTSWQNRTWHGWYLMTFTRRHLIKSHSHGVIEQLQVKPKKRAFAKTIWTYVEVGTESYSITKQELRNFFWHLNLVAMMKVGVHTNGYIFWTISSSWQEELLGVEKNKCIQLTSSVHSSSTPS